MPVTGTHQGEFKIWHIVDRSHSSNNGDGGDHDDYDNDNNNHHHCVFLTCCEMYNTKFFFRFRVPYILYFILLDAIVSLESTYTLSPNLFPVFLYCPLKADIFARL
jgi:hypothetical protein